MCMFASPLAKIAPMIRTSSLFVRPVTKSTSVTISRIWCVSMSYLFTISVPTIFLKLRLIICRSTGLAFSGGPSTTSSRHSQDRTLSAHKSNRTCAHLFERDIGCRKPISTRGVLYAGIYGKTTAWSPRHRDWVWPWRRSTALRQGHNQSLKSAQVRARYIL